MKNKFSIKDIIYKKKRLAATCMIIAFGAGAIFISSLESDVPLHDGEILVDSANVEQNVPASSFEENRASLELERNKLLAALDESINNSENEDEKNSSSEEKDRIMEYMETELTVEQLLSSENLPESMVIITENSVNVTVDMENLDTVTVAKICDIVMRETGKTADKIIVQSLH